MPALQHLNRPIFWFFLLLLSYGLLRPTAQGPSLFFPHFDKVAHFGAFFLLTLFLIRAYRMNFSHYLILVSCYAIITEYLQGLTGYRSAELLDFAADMLGSLSLFGLIMAWPRAMQRITGANLND